VIDNETPVVFRTKVAMLFGKYQFLCHLESDAVLPPFKGSTFRGVFGRALKNVVCTLKAQECSECLLKERCVYALVFETQVSTETPKRSRIASLPHPFVIEPPLDTETNFSKGSSFDFHLLLFGETNRNLPYFIYAFEQMGKVGIGRRIDGKRGHFSLDEVRADSRPIYSSSDQKLNTDNIFQALSLDGAKVSLDEYFKLTVHIITPLRIKFKNKLKADLPFHVMVRAMLRRVSSLFSCYGDGEPELDYRGMVKRSEDVRIVEDNLRWHDCKRYSFRQEKAMLMGGIVGSITYEGKIGEYMPLIDLCSIVHLGKQTSFGLGKIETEKE